MIQKMVSKRPSSIVFMFLAPSKFSCEQGLDRQMSNWGHAMGFGYGGEYMWFTVLVLFIVVVYFLYRLSKSKCYNGSIMETPLDTLKRRHAKGEIDKEEFNRRKKDL